MEEMKWFGSVMCGVSAASNLGFGFYLRLESAKLLANYNSEEGLACQKSATQKNIVTLLIGLC
jgi:hypothetical protein